MWGWGYHSHLLMGWFQISERKGGNIVPVHTQQWLWQGWTLHTTQMIKGVAEVKWECIPELPGASSNWWPPFILPSTLGVHHVEGGFPSKHESIHPALGRSLGWGLQHSSNNLHIASVNSFLFSPWGLQGCWPSRIFQMIAEGIAGENGVCPLRTSYVTIPIA